MYKHQIALKQHILFCFYYNAQCYMYFCCTVCFITKQVCTHNSKINKMKCSLLSDGIHNIMTRLNLNQKMIRRIDEHNFQYLPTSLLYINTKIILLIKSYLFAPSTRLRLPPACIHRRPKM